MEKIHHPVTGSSRRHKVRTLQTPYESVPPTMRSRVLLIAGANDI
jgi:hypothetical protein